jgi:hypothetical protein
VQHRVPASRASWNYFRSRCYAEGLSKALVTRLVGTAKGLDTERSYILKTLPGGLGRGLLASLKHLDFSGLGLSGAIATGLTITVFGYIKGKLFNSLSGDLFQSQLLQNDSSAMAGASPQILYVESGSTS